jgi:hypothetical protein
MRGLRIVIVVMFDPCGGWSLSGRCTTTDDSQRKQDVTWMHGNRQIRGSRFNDIALVLLEDNRELRAF